MSTPTAQRPAAFVTWTDEDGYQQAAATYGTAQAAALHVGVQERDRSPNGHPWSASPFSGGVGFIENIIKDRENIHKCIQAYERFGLVRNVIDLMGDFACQGVKVVHPRGKVEKFGQEWFARFNGPERSERMLNMLFKAGNVVVKRRTAKLPDRTLDVLRASGADTSVKLPKYRRLADGEIPMGYSILDPRWVQVIGGEIGPFVGPQALQYAVRVPPELARRLKSPSAGERPIVGLLPAAVVNIASGDGRLVPLPQNKTATMFFKKDDSRVWAVPLLYSILDDLELLWDLKRADRAALNGAISKVRLWRLGSLEHRIFPTQAAVERLQEVLLSNAGGGSLDLIWGPELDLVETSTDLYQFLGEEKYKPTLQAIFQGLGVPMTLTGSNDGGMTNNALGLKVLIDRLAYGRMLLTAFWKEELEILRAAFGFREPFELSYDAPSLTDEATVIKLLIDMADRDLISREYLVDRIGADPKIEASRLRREVKDRASGKLPPKADPFHLDSQQKATLERAFVQQGTVTPSQVGIDHPPPKPGEKTLVDRQNEQKLAEMSKKAATLSQKKTKKKAGRPVGAKDGGKRKQKRVMPRTKASELAAAMAWAAEAQQKIEEAIRAPFLAARGKKNLRQATDEEAREFEGFKFAVLCHFPVGGKVTRAGVKQLLETTRVTLPAGVADLYRATVARQEEPPTAEKARQIQAAVYALYESERAEGAEESE